jgi:hypothetical protein
MKTKKTGKTVFRVGDLVTLVKGAKQAKINDFDLMPQPYFFDCRDVGTVINASSPRIWKKKGFPDCQTVVEFKKISFKGVEVTLIARVETTDLQLTG